MPRWIGTRCYAHRAAIARMALACLVLLVTIIAVLGSADSHAHSGMRRLPNIIVIQTDDQTLAELREPHVMPFTRHLVGDHGTAFSDHIVTTPVCCPSRASLLTGQYAHNHRVTSNRPGYPQLVRKRNVLPVWLQRAGYRTAHVGKFL